MYSAAFRDEVIRLASEGKSYSELSRMFGGKPSKTTIGAWCNGYKPSGHRRPRAVIPIEKKLEALRRLEEGEHYTEIARGLGCAPETVIGWRRLYSEKGVDGLKTSRDILRELQRKAKTERDGGQDV